LYCELGGKRVRSSFTRECVSAALGGDGRWRELDELFRIAAGAGEAREIAVGLLVGGEGLEGFAKHAGHGWIRGRDDAVVLPESFTTGADQAAATEIGEVARNPWLAGLQSLDEIADTYFVVAHEVEQAQTGAIGEASQKGFEIERRFGHEMPKNERYIPLDIYITRGVRSSLYNARHI
jgi:hypothetical protein